MNSFYEIIRQSALSLIHKKEHCLRFWPFQSSDTPWAEFELVLNLSPSIFEWSCAVVITTRSQRHKVYKILSARNDESAQKSFTESIVSLKFKTQPGYNIVHRKLPYRISGTQDSKVRPGTQDPSMAP